jgi:hypothetical protein
MYVKVTVEPAFLLIGIKIGCQQLGRNVLRQCSVKSHPRVPGIWQSNFTISNAGKLAVEADSNVPITVSHGLRKESFKLVDGNQ